MDKGKNLTDFVQDIQIVKIPNDHKKITAIGWQRQIIKGVIMIRRSKGFVYAKETS